ncbi:glycerophosphodiester phosphodiesterase [Phytoactinopolyspora limicola]|uniref:glycerophosphodiester phosphodiesterase n=1 Tax=Phytoactinopolyspora limicola TaxID=2715536 RepID=UPI00140A112C|nr:glycerophosphodiester phosphodiesterase family protein [Phytoactinopolyspora limicola]
MPVVRIDLRRPDGAAASGRVTFTPSRRVPTPDHVILPDPVSATLAGGTVDVDLVPTDSPDHAPGTWAWQVTELTRGGSARLVLVPTSDDVLEYVDLVDVDPDTLDPVDPVVVGVPGPEGPPGPPGDGLEPVVTVDDLLAATPFVVAHRGGQDDGPEHTMKSYETGVSHGALAIEVSVCRTRDNVLICHHDLNTERVTGADLHISQVPWARLVPIEVDAAQWLGPAVRPQPITLLRDVLDRFAGRVVMFIEDKPGTATEQLLDLMDSYPRSTEYMVWKCYRAGGATAAQARGYRVWGYLDDDDPNLDDVAEVVDMLGVSTGASDAFVGDVVAKGLPVMMWPIHRRSERDRAVALGVQGLMTAGVPYVRTDTPQGVSEAGGFRDAFAAGYRMPGDLPWNTVTWGWQPAWIEVDGEYVIELDHQFGQAYMVGSICPTPAADYAVEAELRFPDLVPFASSHVGLAFARDDDVAYRFNTQMPTGGYHVLLRGNGDFQLYRHDPGVAAGTQLASISTPAPVSGEWIPIRIEVGPSQIVARRMDTDHQISTNSTTYRGHYVHVSRNYDDAAGERHVQWRNVRWVPL